ncbi:hypothetical protein GM30_05120 [Trabulsiella odontotermitis]|nr:hypothetical protein GM30_05120 [Trabulsiella odontotermitis]
MMKNKSIPDIVYLGIDIGKNSFHIAGLNSSGNEMKKCPYNLYLKLTWAKDSILTIIVLHMLFNYNNVS